MNLTRCENGHFYDAERFEYCPHCNQTAPSTVALTEGGTPEYTQPLGTQIQDAKDEDQGAKTIGFFGEVTVEPVVGWLVCIEGSCKGKDFRLKTGRNFIGRSYDMDVVLEGDSSISRNKHAVIVYEPRGNMFLVQPGDAKELFYLNDRVVLGATEVNAYDVLSLGDTKLLFVPCCSSAFKWDIVKSKEEK